MRYVKSSIPMPSLGIRITEPTQVVPDQSLSLKEILHRFVRQEALPVSHQGQYGSEIMDPEVDNPLNVDLEKLRYADLTEKDEYKEATKQVQREYDAQEKAKADKARKEAQEKAEKDFEARVSTEVAKRAKGEQNPKGSI